MRIEIPDLPLATRLVLGGCGLSVTTDSTHVPPLLASWLGLADVYQQKCRSAHAAGVRFSYY